MNESTQKTEQFWQQLLKESQQGAMSDTLEQIQQLIGKDNTTAKQLADIILKDPTLTIRVLTVANSVMHRTSQNHGDGGSLTRAIIKIGFSGLHAICISTALMDTFLQKIPHQPELLRCINDSFESAIHARNFAKITEASQEDCFIAGMMQNLGELVFWCSKIPGTSHYQQLMEFVADSPEQALKKLSGIDFEDLSKLLAEEWQLSELLLQTFRADITPATKAVHLGRRICQARKLGWESKELNRLLQVQIKDLGLNIINGMALLKEGAAEAQALTSSYAPTEPEPVQQQTTAAEPRPSQTIAQQPQKSTATTGRKVKQPTALIRS